MRRSNPTAPHPNAAAPRPNRLGTSLSTLAVLIVAGPVVGILMGAIYSAPAMRLVGTRPRLLTLTLAASLVATTVALGATFGTSLFWLVIQWPPLLASLLLRHRSYGTLDGNYERFGLVHYGAIALGGWIGTLTRLHALPVVF